ncbi:MAG TPA: hypothetical protein VFH68_07890 [Polyangia bacterium]|nr:hypothetical protein [Polyangia bacterium]
MTSARLVAWPMALLALVLPSSGRAYDPATTHAGLTQRAALASGLHAVLAKRLGRPLGLFEPIRLSPHLVPGDQGRLLAARLSALDPAGGYRPGDDGVATSVAWLVAGSVIAWTPAERAQNSFLDPGRGEGLRQAQGVADLGQSVRGLLDGGSLRGWATGTNFSFEGPPSTAWLRSPQNDVGLPVFYDQLELAVAGADRAARNTALARTLMALGGVLAVLEDAGEPAHVRNDFRGAFLRAGESGSPGPFNRGSAFERFVADSYGAGGVPAAGAPVDRPTLMAYFTAGDAQGLADRTQRRFFSDGSLPEDGIVDRGTTSQDIVHAARKSLPFGLPTLPRLELRPMGRTQYVCAVGDDRQGRLVLTSRSATVGSSSAGGAAARGTPGASAGARAAEPSVRRMLAYQRVPGRVRFFLDRAVYQDTARALLPEIGAFAAGLIDHLLRGEVSIQVDGATARLSVTGVRGALRGGKLRLFAEDAVGLRHEVGSWPASALVGGQEISVAVPAGTRLLAAVLRGQDDAGELVAPGERAAPAQ